MAAPWGSHEGGVVDGGGCSSEPRAAAAAQSFNTMTEERVLSSNSQDKGPANRRQPDEREDTHRKRNRNG